MSLPLWTVVAQNDQGDLMSIHPLTPDRSELVHWIDLWANVPQARKFTMTIAKVTFEAPEEAA